MRYQRLVGSANWLIFGASLGFFFGRVLPGRPLDAQVAAPAAAPSASKPDADPYDQLARSYEQFQSIDRTFAQVARAVSPTVVHIVSRKKGVREDGSAARFEETGSGVITHADSDGGAGRYVLTNSHVVEGAAPEEINLHLYDGRVLKPVRVWSDPKVDVAVMRVEGADLPTARLANSDDVVIGTCVMAVGSPFGLTHSVSQGIISARGRFEAELEEDGVENQDFLQTDAAINPGNSGGPLVNMKGEVVGINTAIASNGGGSEGVGFSIPINLARWAMNQLVTTGKVNRGAIGVQLRELSARDADMLGLARPQGARVGGVQTGSPAHKAGLTAGDIVLRFNGAEVRNYNHLINLVSTTPIGQRVTLQIWRDKKLFSAEVEVADRAVLVRPEEAAAPRTGQGGYVRRPRSQDSAARGLREADLAGLEVVSIDGASAARRNNLGDTARGVLVSKIETGHALASVFQPRDLIQAVDGHALGSAQELKQILQGHGQHSFQILRTEEGVARTRIVELKLP